MSIIIIIIIIFKDSCQKRMEMNWRCSLVVAVLERKSHLPAVPCSARAVAFIGFRWCFCITARVCQWLTLCPQLPMEREEVEYLKSSPIWVFFLPGDRTALTCSPERVGTWWFLIWGKWGEIDVKKQTPSPHWNVLTNASNWPFLLQNLCCAPCHLF